jgi:glutaconyl-CoA/methylmalonyl-CoA decarboxylase subunit gamma
MRYYVQISGREHQVDLQKRPDGSVGASVNGREVALDVVTLAPRELSVRVDAQMLDMTVEGTPPQLGVVAAGRRTYVHVESDRMRAASKAAGAGGAKVAREIRSPMPGRVVKFLVAPGDTVAAGQPVVIVEAMKMENEVKAKGPATVSKIHVAAGANVEANAVLVSFES